MDAVHITPAQHCVATPVQISNWYTEYGLILLNEGLRFGYSAEDVKDLLQQFFLDLIEKQTETSLIQNPKAYLTIAFRRKLIDYHRSKQRKSTVSMSSSIEDEVCEGSSLLKMEVSEQNKALVESILRAFKKLPKRCKKVIYLKYSEGKTAEEIALITGLTKRSVYNNLFEGIQILRKDIQKNNPGVETTVLLSMLPIIILNFV